MSPLEQLLIQRALAQQSQAPPTPVTPPSGGRTNTPSQVKRFANAQQIQDAYRNGWAPNPVLLQATLKG